MHLSSRMTLQIKVRQPSPGFPVTCFHAQCRNTVFDHTSCLFTTRSIGGGALFHRANLKKVQDSADVAKCGFIFFRASNVYFKYIFFLILFKLWLLFLQIMFIGLLFSSGPLAINHKLCFLFQPLLFCMFFYSAPVKQRLHVAVTAHRLNTC